MNCGYCHKLIPISVYMPSCDICGQSLETCSECKVKISELSIDMECCSSCALSFFTMEQLIKVLPSLSNSSIGSIVSILTARQAARMSANTADLSNSHGHGWDYCYCVGCQERRQTHSYTCSQVILTGLARVKVVQDFPEELVNEVVERLRGTGGDFVDADLRVAGIVEAISSTHLDSERGKVRRIKVKE